MMMLYHCYSPEWHTFGQACRLLRSHSHATYTCRPCKQSHTLLQRAHVRFSFVYLIGAPLQVSYREFVPTAFALLRERTAAQAARAALSASDAQLAALVRSCFAHFDAAGSGEVTPRMARHALSKVSDDLVPLSTYQIHALLATIAPKGVHAH